MPDSISEVLPHILEKYKDKVIVLDFWETWCGPCVGELRRFYPEFINKFKKEEVAFVFIASSSPKDTWQRFLNELEFDAEQYYLTSRQYAILQHCLKSLGFRTTL